MSNLKQFTHVGVIEVLEAINTLKSPRFTDIASATNIKPVPLSRAQKVVVSLGLVTKRRIGSNMYAHEITKKGKEALKLGKKLIEVLDK